MKITKSNITFPLVENDFIQKAFFYAYQYERKQGHLYEADKYYKIVKEIEEWRSKNVKS